MSRYTPRQLRDLDSLADLESTREEALEFECDDCGAEPGHRCVNTSTGDLLNAPAHPKRITATRKKEGRP
ncbi:hypothetical protein NQK81_13380 [Amycolatopsis roodepoortensis]|uniref:zinc finger domain-containing protein n=1 Tax=Amycolatopsis roodepoortensis TaxID=700274 RepID=UPI00214C9CAC|nr:hypothetical protein [Amycolatopsis roodepoortensis]UUV34397.1 hypothetical protein NQK81_13380 [Amycolatopsis roodepoortensis]